MKGSHIKERATDQDKLQQKFKALQQEWESYKQSSPRITHRRYYSTDSNAMANKALQQLDCSPSNLVSSLHHRLSPSEGGRKIRTSVLAMEEILQERLAAIESGWIKGGRRLFEALEDETEMAFEIESGRNKDLPVCLSGEKWEEKYILEEEKKVLVAASMETKRVAYGGSGNRRRWMVSLTGWLIIASIFVYAICIVPLRSFGGYGDEHEMLLVPT